MTKKRSAPKPADTEANASPFHSAFAGLAPLRDELPVGDAPIDPPADTAPASGEQLPRKIVVRRERKGRKGKTVTRIAGFDVDIAQWARRMKQELGCGGSVEGDQIILAGDLCDRAAHWLEAAGIRQVIRGN